MIAVGIPKWKICRYCGREIEVVALGANAFRAESKHGWTGPILQSEAAVEAWLKKAAAIWEVGIYKPQIIAPTGAAGHFVVTSKLDWSSQQFFTKDQAERWLQFRNGEGPAEPQIEIRHNPQDMGEKAMKSFGRLPECGLNVPDGIQELIERNGAPTMENPRPFA